MAGEEAGEDIDAARILTGVRELVESRRADQRRDGGLPL
jgi:hypothetical protein